MKKSNNKICVITMTYNRPEYIIRSFESLYKRAGISFSHYVFDDCSDKKTQNILKELQKKFKFTLFHNEERLGLYKNFHKNIRKLPKYYDYYLKMDSDIEVLTDDIFSQMLLHFSFPSNVGAITVRMEGLRNIDRYDTFLQFYGGDVLKLDHPIIYGCFMMFTNNVFNAFEQMTDQQLKQCNEKWGIDSALYSHAIKMGKFLIIESLSCYHIDNTYGQRKKDNNYFTERRRWEKIDRDEIWYMKASKIIYPKYIPREIYVELIKDCEIFSMFVKKCKEYLKNPRFQHRTIIESAQIIQSCTREKNIAKKTKIEQKNKIQIQTMYRICSPLNFGKSDKHILKGECQLFSEIPDWAKNNPVFVIEKVENTINQN